MIVYYHANSDADRDWRDAAVPTMREDGT